MLTNILITIFLVWAGLSATLVNSKTSYIKLWTVFFPVGLLLFFIVALDEGLKLIKKIF